MPGDHLRGDDAFLLGLVREQLAADGIADRETRALLADLLEQAERQDAS